MINVLFKLPLAGVSLAFQSSTKLSVQVLAMACTILEKSGRTRMGGGCLEFTPSGLLSSDS